MKAADDRPVDADPSDLTTHDAASSRHSVSLGVVLFSGMALFVLSYPDPGLSAVGFFLVLASALGWGIGGLAEWASP